MKRLLFFTGILLSLTNGFSQRIVEKTHTTRGISEIYLELKYATEITIESWNKNKAAVKVSVNLNNNTKNNEYSLDFEKDDDYLKMKADFGDFMKRRNYIMTSSDCPDYKYCNTMDIKYTLYLPKDKRFTLKSISGDAIINNAFSNDVTVDLVSGNIDVKKTSKNMDLHSVSGDIDVALKNAKFYASTFNGGFYSNLNTEFDFAGSRSKNRISGQLKNGKDNVRIKTTTGDVFLRKE